MLPTLVSFAGRVPALLLHAAWQAGFLALLVFAVTWLLGSRIAPRWRFALWLIVFARLGLPVLPSAPWSLFQLVGEVTVDRPLARQPLESTQVDNWLNQQAQMTEPWPEGLPEDELARPRTATTRANRPPTTAISLSSLAAVVWAVVSLGLLLRLIASSIKLRRLQRAWQPITHGVHHALLQQCRQNMGIRRHVGLYATLDNLGPATCGIFQPRIILSKQLFAALSPPELRLVLLHELVHVQRHDVLIDLCVTLIASVHWFHPVGWLARYFLRRERELACDAAVLDHSEAIASADYGDVMIKAVESLITPAPLPGVVGMFGLGTLSLLRRRIQLIAAYRRSTRIGLVGGAALVAGLALIGLTDAQSPPPTEKGTQQSAAAARTTDGQKGEAAPSPPSSKSNATEENAEARVRRHPLTVKGRALNKDGQPIAGATVFLVATNSGPDEMLGQAITDKSGRYEFNKAQLPYYPTEKKDRSETGAFQVFGKAPEHGFAWLGMRFLFIGPGFLDENGKLNVVEPKHGYLPTDNIEQDLQFAPAMPVVGRFVDQHGQPIAGVKVSVTNCDYLDKEGKETNTAFREFRYAVRQAARLMPEQVQATSDAAGRFQLLTIPAGIVCRLHMSHPEFGKWAIYTATVDNPPAEINGDPIVRLPIEMTRQKTRSVTVDVRYADTREPVVGALVGAYIQIGTNNSWGTSDNDGKVTLNLPPDEYTLWSHPPKGQDYLSVHSKFTVYDKADQQPAEVKLPPACVLVLKAIDADTGEGIEGVTFWFEEELIYKRWSVQSNDTTNDFPATDASGVLRALVAPGERTYGVPFNPLPGNYRADEADIRGRRLTLTPGQTMTEEFQLRSTRNATKLKEGQKLPGDKLPSDKIGAAVTPANSAVAEAGPPSPIPPPAPYKLSVSRRVESPAAPAVVTVSGRALDERGRPIEGAQIFLINANFGAPEKLAGEAVTDAAGRYEFRDAKLERLGVSEIEEGRRSYKTVYFRLAGIAPGRAFAWRGMKKIYLNSDEAERAGLGTSIIARPDPHLDSFAPWEKIELDLTFPPPQPISGRLVDEAGQAVRGAAVHLQGCFRSSPADPPAHDHEYFCPNPTHWKAPQPVANSIYAKTDDDGRFILPGGPPGVQCDLGVSHPDFAPLTVCVSTADRPPQTNRNDEPVLPLPLDLKLRALRTIAVTVQRQDTGEPLAEALVWANEIASAGGTRSGSYGGCGELDKNGQGKMKLPPGKYRLNSSLWRNTFIHQQEQELVVADSPTEQSVIIRMRPDRTR